MCGMIEYYTEDVIIENLNQFREYHRNNSSLGLNVKKKTEYEQEFNMGGLDYVTARWIKGGMNESP